MFQIETIMPFAPGFILAALIAMFLGRGLWSYGVKIGQRRMQKLLPTSITELQADRDRLRAEYAIMTRKLELRLDNLKDRMAKQMVAVSRHKTRIEKLHGEVGKRDGLLLERARQIAAIRANSEPLESELVARTVSIQQLKEQLRNKAELVENLERENVQLRLRAEEKYAGAMEFEKRAKELTETVKAQKDDLSNQQKEINSLIISLSDNQEELDRNKAQANAEKLSSEAGVLERSMAETEAEAHKLREEFADLDKNWENRKNRRKTAKKKRADAPRKSATVTPLRPPAKTVTKKSGTACKKQNKSAPKKGVTKTVTTKKSAANKKGKPALPVVKASRGPVEEKLFKTVIADKDAAQAASGVSSTPVV